MAHRPGSPADAELEDQLSKRLVSTLEPVVGAQRIRASVNVDYDTSTSEENQETYDPKSAVAVTMQTSEEKTSGGETDRRRSGNGQQCTQCQTPAKYEEEEVDDTVQSSKTQNATYAVDKIVRHTLQPVGRIRRISAALLIDDAVETQQANGKATETRRKRTPEELKQIEALAAAAIGFDEKRGDTLAVQNLSFQQSAQQTPAPPSKVERIRVVVNDWSSLIRYGVIFRVIPPDLRAAAAPDQETGALCLQSTTRQVGGTIESGDGRRPGSRSSASNDLVRRRATIDGLAETACGEGKKRARSDWTTGSIVVA